MFVGKWVLNVEGRERKTLGRVIDRSGSTCLSKLDFYTHPCKTSCKVRTTHASRQGLRHLEHDAGGPTAVTL